MSGIAGEGCQTVIPLNERQPVKDIERSIITKYRKVLWGKFIRAIKDFEMLKEGDKVAVAMSGGKDSLLMAKLFQELKRHNRYQFELEFIVMDPGYHQSVKELLVANCEHLQVPIHIFESKIFDILDEQARDNPCYLCARMRRGSLYSKAQELGCNKLALGHHFNDVIETTLLNMLYTGTFETMLPKLKSTNFQGIELIRPLYYVEESNIERFTQQSGIWPLNCACMVAAKKTSNKRFEIKALVKELKESFADVDKSIFNAAQNVNMHRILGWRKNGKRYSYLDFYDEE